MHAVAVEAFPDIPTADEPVAAGPLDEFRARDVDRDRHPARTRSSSPSTRRPARSAGYACLMFVPGSTTMAWHDMTAVGRR